MHLMRGHDRSRGRLRIDCDGLKSSLKQSRDHLAESVKETEDLIVDHSVTVPVTGPEETQHLGEVLNHMLESIRDHIQLQQKNTIAIDESRKLLVDVIENTTALVSLKTIKGHYILANHSFLQTVAVSEEHVFAS